MSRHTRRSRAGAGQGPRLPRVEVSGPTLTPRPDGEITQPRKRVSPGVLFAALTAACLIVAAGYVAVVALRNQSGGTLAASALPTGPTATTSAAIQGAPHLVFQHVVRDDNYAKVAVVPLSDPDGPRVMTDLSCERVYEAAGHGLCLVPDKGLIAQYWAIVFGSDFREQARIQLIGSPSRARVSADGRYGATTVFVYGHSYADAQFSTQTTIVDMARGTPVAELEQFAVFRDDVQIHSPDFNFWGVTFASDSNTFYATLRTGGQTFLVKGDIVARQLRVLHASVECPSLSPDGTRIAYKKPVGDQGDWRFTVLDLATMAETPLAEMESVDDQIEWMDNQQVMYGKAGGLWIVPSDGSGSPKLLVHDALSPAVVR